MLIARVDVKTTNPLNESVTFGRGAAMKRRSDHRKQKEFTARVLTAVVLRRGKEGMLLGCAVGLANSGGRPRVVLRRVSPGTRPMDGDGLRASLKWVRDSVAEFFGVDDGDKNIEWAYEQRRGRPGEYAVEIELP